MSAPVLTKGPGPTRLDPGAADPSPRKRRRRHVDARARLGAPGALGLGITGIWLSVIVLIPLAAVVIKSTETDFWKAATKPVALDALELTLWTSAVVAAINAFFGTLTAWVLVRDKFRGKGVINVLVDLPFALPTVVAGLTLLALYGESSPFGIDIAFTRWAIIMALAFVTLPFVVRAVQPVIMELDREMEEAAHSLGASPTVTFRRVVLPALIPSILSGAALSFARAVGEFGSVILVGGTQPGSTQTSSVYIFSLAESAQDASKLGSAAAVAVVLLVISLLVLVLIRVSESLFLRGGRHGR